jgi:hypothetical protein
MHYHGTGIERCCSVDKNIGQEQKAGEDEFGLMIAVFL